MSREEKSLARNQVATSSTTQTTHTKKEKEFVVNLKIMIPPVGRLVRLTVGCNADMFMSLRKKETFKERLEPELDDLFLLSFFVVSFFVFCFFFFFFYG